jgi:hypothetical protein
VRSAAVCSSEPKIASPPSLTHVQFSGGRRSGDQTAWLAFLNTVRTERFDQVLALRPLLPAIPKPGAALSRTRTDEGGILRLPFRPEGSDDILHRAARVHRPSRRRGGNVAAHGVVVVEFVGLEMSDFQPKQRGRLPGESWTSTSRKFAASTASATAYRSPHGLLN